MCGICGFVNIDDFSLLKKMCDLIISRGPDSYGYYFDKNIGLGNRRLKIIDLNTGDQPIYNEDKSIIIVYNGEIYNYMSLKEELEKKGHKFYTTTDTEVIVHLYEEYKEKSLTYLIGMFAFAIWDKNERKLFIARDSLGIKPLYYYFKNDKLIFASELKSILACNFVLKDIDFKALDLYFTYLYIPDPLTIFKNVKKLEPGSYIIFKDDKLEIKKYFDLTLKEDEMEVSNEKEILEILEDNIKKVIYEHLIADVPVGLFLSGGLDSSTILHFSAQNSKYPLKTFSIGYSNIKDSSYNELDKAKFLSQIYHTEHNEFILDAKEIKDLFYKSVVQFDEPFADSSSILTYFISEQASKHVKVALSGIGGDEIFGGYPRYLGVKYSKLYEVLPYSLRKLILNISNILPDKFDSFNWNGRIKRFLNGGILGFRERYKDWITFLKQDFKKDFYSNEFYFKVLKENDFMDDYFSLIQKNDLNTLLLFDLKTYLPFDLLYMADRMSMSNSLELRVPFCDIRIVNFMQKVPFSLKIKGNKLKYLLKKLMKDKLPDEIINQKKKGFMLPLSRWIQEELNDVVEYYISEERLQKSGYFNYIHVKKILNEHKYKVRNWSDLIYAIIVFEIWKEKFKI